MKRPLIGFSALFAIGVGTEILFDIQPHFVLSATALFLLVLFSRLLPRSIPIIICLTGMVCGVTYGAAYHTVLELPAEELDGSVHEIVAKTTEYPEIYEDTQRVSVTISGEQLGLKHTVRSFVSLPLTKENLEPGDLLSLTGEFYRPTELQGFDRETYYRSIGYSILVKNRDGTFVTVTKPDSRPVSYYPKALGHRLGQNIQVLFPDRQEAFLSALLLGDKSHLSTIDTNHLRKAGLSHVVVVSGLHVGFLIALLLVLFGRKIGSILGIPTLVLFAMMVGWSPSVIRACVMYGTALVAFLIKEQADSFNSLFAALLIVLLWLPASLLSVSLQLSFVSTAAILQFGGILQKAFYVRSKKIPFLLRRLLAFFAASVVCSVSTLLLTFPILLYHFGYVSVLSPFSNLLTLWAVTLAYPLGIMVSLCSLVSLSAASVLAAPLSLLVKYIWAVADFCSSIQSGLLYIGSIPDCVVVFIFLVGYLLILRFGNRRTLMIATPVLLICLLGFSWFLNVSTRNQLRICCLSESYGQAVVVTKGEKTALIDCSSSGSLTTSAEDVAVYLDWWGYDHVDALVLTAYNQTHCGDLLELLEQVPIHSVYAPPAEEKSQTMNDLLTALYGTQNYHEIDKAELTQIADPELGLCVICWENHLVVGQPEHSIWFFHSLTQNRLLSLLEKEPISSRVVVVSRQFFDQEDKVSSILTRLQPDEIIVESGKECDDSIFGIPIRCTRQEGDITLVQS